MVFHTRERVCFAQVCAAVAASWVLAVFFSSNKVSCTPGDQTGSPRSALTTLLTAVLVVSGCAGSSGAASTTAAAIAIDPSSTSPIADFLGFDLNNNDAQRQRQAEIEGEAGDISRQCMLENRFQFTPPRSTGQSASGQRGGDLLAGSAEWIEKYGFGISTLYFPQAMVGNLVGIPDDEAPITSADVERLNAAYTESLSETELDAYYLALRGTEAEGDGPQGCIDAAFEHIRSSSVDTQGIMQTLGDDFEELYSRIDADSRVVEFYAEIGMCVADTGLEFNGFSETSQQLIPRVQALQAELEATNSGEQRLSEAGLAELSKLQDEELALAAAVVACGGGPDETKKAIGAVQAEYERDFLAENGDELAAFVPAD